MTTTDHRAEALRALRGDPEAHPYRATSADIALREAQVHATLALADEQRTATLVAWLNICHWTDGDLAPDERTVAATIRTRLGLDS